MVKYKLKLPKIVDPDDGATVTWTYSQSTPPIADTISSSSKGSNYLTINATTSEIGVHNITLNATDGIDSTLLSFQITIFNSPPYF